MLLKKMEFSLTFFSRLVSIFISFQSCVLALDTEIPAEIQNCIARVEVQFDEEEASGTIFFIEEKFALTAAHVVYNQHANFLAQKITAFIKNKDGETELEVQEYILSQKYFENKCKVQAEEDYALLYFGEKNDVRIDSYLSLALIEEGEEGKECELYGYPEESKNLAKVEVTIDKVENKYISIHPNGAKGMSGGPIVGKPRFLDGFVSFFSSTKGKREAISIFSSGWNQGRGCRITKSVLDNLEEWKKFILTKGTEEELIEGKYSLCKGDIVVSNNVFNNIKRQFTSITNSVSGFFEDN